MHIRLLTVLMAFAALTAPAFGLEITDLTFTLVSNAGSGYPTRLNPDPDPPCLQPNCVQFSGTLTDTDNDTSQTYPYMGLIGISLAFTSNPAHGALTLDNTFTQDNAIPGVLSGDPNYATDNSGNPPNSYTGPLFGIDIAPGTTVGNYTGTITISAAGGDDDPNYNGFTVQQSIDVQVTPEPAAASLALAGLASLVVCGGIKRKWHSSVASR